MLSTTEWGALWRQMRLWEEAVSLPVISSLVVEPMLPGRRSGKESACQCSRHTRQGFNPWVEKIPLEEEMATHSSTIAWKIPWREEPDGLQSMGSQRVRHNWGHTHTQWNQYGSGDRNWNGPQKSGGGVRRGSRLLRIGHWEFTVDAQ